MRNQPSTSVRRRARTPAAVLLALVAAAALGAPSAGAHGETNPSVRTVIEGVEPPLEDVEVKVVAGVASQLSFANNGAVAVDVLAGGGEPFLRVGPGGVEANLNSIEWYRSGNADGVAEPPPEADIGGPPRWERVSGRPEWSWFEHRAHPRAFAIPPEAVAAQESARLGEFRVPLRQAGRESAIAGYVEYRPVLGNVLPSLTSPTTLAPGVTVAVLTGRVPGLFLSSSTKVPVTVAGRLGEPFARITPRGVQVNLRSPTHLDDLMARGELPQEPVDPAAPPLWRRVAEVPRYGWLESRTRYQPEQPPDQVLRSAEPTVLTRWRIPVDVGGRRVDIAGDTRWIPIAGAARAEGPGGDGGPTPTLLAAGGALVCLLLFVMLGVRRRAAGSAPGHAA